MPRSTNSPASRRRRKRVLEQAKGYFGNKSRLYRYANDAVNHALQYAYRDRRNKKRTWRSLWITRLNAACRENGITYSRFIEGVTKAGIGLDRKALADIAVRDAPAFTAIVGQARAGLEKGPVAQEAKAARPQPAMVTKAAASKPVAASAATTPEPKPRAPKAEKVSEPDDLTKVEGIGPKICEIFINNGIDTFAKLAGTSVDRLKEILEAAGPRYKIADPGTWPEQAAIAARGDWDELKKLTDELDHGRRV